jgi:superoxide reductase
MPELKFYRCDHCKNVIVKVHNGGPIPVCCGETMKELLPNTTDAAQEKHVPTVTRENSRITGQCRLGGSSNDPRALY